MPSLQPPQATYAEDTTVRAENCAIYQRIYLNESRPVQLSQACALRILYVRHGDRRHPGGYYVPDTETGITR